MSNRNDFDAAAAMPPAGLACEAQGIRTILHRIADRISETDERHSALLNSMQHRLLALGEETSGLRSRMGYDARDFHASGSGRTDFSGGMSDRPQAQVPLTSALGGDGFRPSPGHSPSGRVDPFDVVGHREQTEKDPWDKESAEALARIYEDAERDGVMAAHQPEHLAAGGRGPAIVARVGEAQAFDRSWLEGRFADIASRVESSLAGIRSDRSLEALTHRFESLEARIESALAQAGPDPELIRALEMQLDDINSRIEDAGRHFARLDHIEGELRTLANRLSDEQLADRYGKMAAGMPDVEGVARAVAEKISAHLPKSDPGRTAGGEQLDKLSEVVNDLVSERRQGDEQTATMLDTMQQAMIRLLDRMDALEGSGPGLDPRLLEEFSAPGPRHTATSRGTEMDRIVPDREQAFGQSGDQHSRPAAQAEDAPVASFTEGNTGEGQLFKQSREDLVSAARRARKMASEKPDQTGRPVDVPATESPSMAAMAAAPVRAPSAPGARKASSGSRLMATVLAIFAVGGLSFTVFSSFGNGGMSRLVERTVGGGAETESGIQSDGQNSGSVLRGNDGEAAPLRKADRQPVDRARPIERRVMESPEGQSDDSVRPAERRVDAGQDLQVGSIDEGTAGGARSVASDADGRPYGVVIQDGAAINAAQLWQLQRQREIAGLSTRLGAAQSPSDVLPASLIPDSPLAPIATGSVDKAQTERKGEMPPAGIGPLSLRNSAAAGNASAEFEIGARFAEGKGIPQDLKQAFSWYQRSAARGFAAAQYRLAALYERGLGIKEDVAKARVWYMRAAEQGHVKAMHNLAVLSAGATPPDYAGSMQWFTAAANRGLADSQYNLAVLYDGGLGIKRDVQQSYKWYSLAALAGDQEAGRRRDALKIKLVSSELAQIDSEIKAWRPERVDQMVNNSHVAGEAWKQAAATVKP